MKRSRILQNLEQDPLIAPGPEAEIENTRAQAEAEPLADEGRVQPADVAEPRLPSPRIKTVAVQYGRKLNLGDFNSAEISLTMWADLDEDEDVQAALDTLYAQAKENVKKQAMPLLKAEPISLNYRETFMGAPVESNRKASNGEKEKQP